MNASPRDKSKSNRKRNGKSNREIAAGGSNGSRTRPASKTLWPALVAINGFGLGVNQATALELGELTLQSSLGQPLRASIAYALAPDEKAIREQCIFLRPAASANGLPTIRDAAVNVTGGVIRLTGGAPVREPLVNINLLVNCPGTANLSRQYSVFVDPVQLVPAPVAEASRSRAPVPAAETTASRTPEVVRAAPASDAAQTTRRVARPGVASDTPIRNQNSYRVQPGDTLSGIAARIEDRDITLWEAVDVIFAANPEAFIDNDRNLLRAGALLVLPDMGRVAAAEPRRAPDVRPAAAGQAAPATTTTAPDRTMTDTAVPAPVPADAGQASATAMPGATPVQAGSSVPRPADTASATDSPFVSPAGTADRDFGRARDLIPDTRVDDAAAPVPAPRVEIAANDRDEGFSSLAWLGGTGIAIILALLLFGRQLRDRFAPSGDSLLAGTAIARRRDDAEDDTRQAGALQDDEPTDQFESPARVQPVTLDADLETGSGFADDGEIDVAQDFGFSTSRDLYGDMDLDLTEQGEQPTVATTNSIPPTRFQDTMIVEEEIPPGDRSGEYDLSMIVDATRQQIAASEDTTKDLRAVQVDAEEKEAAGSDALTLSREIDYKILEQDYEDELTATQALDSKFAEEAARVVRAGKSGLETGAEAPTAEYAAVDDSLTLALPGNDDFDVTAEMPRRRDDQATDLEAPAGLEDSINAEVTTELPNADNDETVALDVETAIADTKKLRAS